MVTVESLKTLFPVSLDEPSITPHLNRAARDYTHIEFEDDLQELEVVGCKTLYYLAPLLFIEMQNKADEYAESLETFKDVKMFRQMWLDRAESALSTQNIEDKDELSWDVI